MLKFQVDDSQLEWSPKRLLIAGYTAKNQVQLLKHIKELEEELGVEPPPTTPMIYDVSPELLTTKNTITVVENHSSGEAEAFITKIDGEWYLGLGSDHTDRKIEAISIQKSKQVCLKPISSQLWKLADVIGHWDDLQMKSWVEIDNELKDYQEGTLAEFMQPAELLAIIKERDFYSDDLVVFCGTLPLKTKEFQYGGVFRAELLDPILDKKIELYYEVQQLKTKQLEGVY